MEIKIEHLSFQYDSNSQVLKNFSCHIPAGSRVCFMGPSGAGKTTLLNLITGFQKPQSGSIEGVDREKISMVFQEDRLAMNLSASANIKMGMFRGLYQKASMNRIEAWDNAKKQKNLIESHLELLGINESDYYKMVSQYSGGMKRRVSIIRAIMSDSKLVILDEPFKGLDEESRQKTIAYINEYIGERTLILVTHNAENAKMLSCEIVDISDEK